MFETIEKYNKDNIFIENIELVLKNNLFKEINKKNNIEYLILERKNPDLTNYDNDALILNIKNNSIVSKDENEINFNKLLDNNSVGIYEFNNKNHTNYIFNESLLYRNSELLDTIEYSEEKNNKIKIKNLFFELENDYYHTKIIFKYVDNNEIYFDTKKEKFCFNSELLVIKKDILIELIEKATFLPKEVKLYFHLYYKNTSNINKYIDIKAFNQEFEKVVKLYKDGLLQNIEKWMKRPRIFTKVNIDRNSEFIEYNKFIEKYNLNEKEMNLIEYFLDIVLFDTREYKLLDQTISFVKIFYSKKSNIEFFNKNIDLLSDIYISYISAIEYDITNKDLEFIAKTMLELEDYRYLILNKTEIKNIKNLQEKKCSLKDTFKLEHTKYFIRTFIKYNNLSYNNKDDEKIINMFKYLILKNPVHGFISMDNFKEDIQKEYIKFYNNKEVDYKTLNEELNYIYNKLIKDLKKEDAIINSFFKNFKKDEKYNIFQKLDIFIFIYALFKKEKEPLNKVYSNIINIKYNTFITDLEDIYYKSIKYNMNFYKIFEKIITISFFQLKKVNYNYKPYIRGSTLKICQNYNILDTINIFIDSFELFERINSVYHIQLDMNKDFNILKFNNRILENMLDLDDSLRYGENIEEIIFKNNIEQNGYVPTFEEFLSIILQKELYNKHFFYNFLKNKDKKITFIKLEKDITVKYNNIIGNDITI